MNYLVPIVVMAGVTYLIRMLPLALFQKKINSRFFRSFLYYVPYAVLSAMTVPAILYATGDIRTGAAGLICGLIAAFLERSLLTVALSTGAGVLLMQLLLSVL